MAKKYNEETLQAEAGSLIRNTNDKLLEVKRTFLEQAEEGLRANLDEIDKNRELAEQSKTTEEKILQELSRATKIQQFESAIILASNNTEIVLQILDTITDRPVFQVARAKAYMLATEQDAKLTIKNKKFRDPEIDKNNRAFAQVRYMSRDFLSPILPIGVDSVESFITGKKLSDYYFG